MYEYILFDLDGTLTDSAEGIEKAVQYALRHYGIEETDPAVLRSFVGPPLSESMMEKYGFTFEQSVEAIVVFREYFERQGIFENRVYDGIYEMLSALQAAGKKMYIVTAKMGPQAIRIAKHFQMDSYFIDYIGTDPEERDKKTDILRKAFDRFGITDKSKAIMIGDRRHDLDAAHANGIDSIGVLYGYGSEEEIALHHPTYKAKSPAEVVEILLRADESAS